MAFDGLLIHHLCAELKNVLIGGRIDKIFQPEKDELSLGIRGQGTHFDLFISTEASMPYFTIKDQRKENPATPPMFCMLMRKHLSGGKILSIEQLGFERVVVIDIEAKNDFGELEAKKLIIEIMGKHSNVILTKADYTIIDSIKRITPDMSRVRTILPGLVFTFIPSDKIDFTLATETILTELQNRAPSRKLSKALVENIQGFSPLAAAYACRRADIDPELLVAQVASSEWASLSKVLDDFKRVPMPSLHKGFVFKDDQGLYKHYYFYEDAYEGLNVQPFEALYHAIDVFYARANKTLKMHQRTNALKKALAQRIERYTLKLAKQELELAEAENADALRKIGDLLYANLYQLSKGMNKVELLDFYADPPENRTIDLDVRLEPAENAQHYFKRYNKLKKTTTELAQHIEETRMEVAYLDQVLTHLENSEDQKTVDEIREELIGQGFIKGKPQKKSNKTSKIQYKTYYSSEGFEILVGKSSLQNDQLTTKIASNKDIWLHTKDIPGSHVIIRTGGESPSETTLYEAATIAAYYSKAKASSNVPVDYTLVKNVSKPHGAKPGMVIYVGHRTLYVTPVIETIQALENPVK